MEYFVVIIFILILLFFSFRLSHSILAPASFMNAIWLSFYIMHMMFGNGFLISMDSVIIVIIFLFCFNFGALLAVNSNNIYKKNRRIVIEKLSLSYNTQKKIKKFILYFTLLSIVASIYYSYLFISYCGGFAMYITADIRSEMSEVPIPLFVRIPLLFSYTTTLIAAVYYINYGGFLRFFLCSLPILIAGATQNGRAGFLMMIFIFTMSSLLRKRFAPSYNKKKFNKLIIKYGVFLAMGGGAFFIAGLMFRLRDSTTNDTSLLIDNFKSYLLGGMSALDTYIHNPKTLFTGFGKYNFSSLYGLLGISKNEVGVYTEYLVFNRSGHTTNIFTLFRPILDDFGYIGGCLYMIFLGNLGHRMYKRAILKDDVALPFMILFYTFLFHSPLLPITVHTSILLSFFLPSIIIKRFSKKISYEI